MGWDSDAVAFFDVGITCVHGTTAFRAPQNTLKGAADDMADWKRNKDEEACSDLRKHDPAANLALANWKFYPLCADSAGGWTQETQKVLQTCGKRVDKEKRGVAMNLWRQHLATALQKENDRVLISKVNCCLGDGPHWLNWNMNEESYVDKMEVQTLDLIPGI